MEGSGEGKPASSTAPSDCEPAAKLHSGWSGSTLLPGPSSYWEFRFTVLIWGSDRGKFGAPETVYQDRDICVTGQIKQFRGTPEIVVSDPKQIKIQSGRSQ
jgi:hypothetical protein